MRNTKIGKFFTTLIYTVLLTIPMLSVLVRVIYVQSNHNAKDSYYGENINDTTYTSVTLDNLVLNNTYYVVNTSTTVSYEYLPTNTEITINNVYINDVFRDVSKVRVYVTTSNSNLYFQFIGNDPIIWTTGSIFSFRFNFLGVNNYSYQDAIDTLLYSVSYNKYSYLDNAFDYSLSIVVNEYGTGNINFVNWFGSLFFTNTNQLYFNFVNMYLNYALYISACYLFYLILSWFIKFITNLIENSFLDKARKE